MGFEDYISEREAATRAGVSTRTLQRFAEAGYLHVEIEPDGLRLYPRSEIEEIFGVHQGPRAEDGNGPVAATLEALVGDPPEWIGDPATNIDLDQAVRTDLEAPAAASEEESPKPLSIPIENSDTNTVENPRSQDEIERLKNLIKAQEKILDMKEAEIRDLRMQRDWLQTRVERLEEKSERDQILLLSETQTIRKLISIQEQKRFSVRQFLEWLGLTPMKPMQTLPPGAGIVTETAPQSTQSSIEVKKAANG